MNEIMSHQNTSSTAEKAELQRSLSNRHLQLIAIGGAIGTGLFMGSGKTISLAGPSILIIYMIIIKGTYGEAKVFTDNIEPKVVQDIHKILDSPVAINANIRIMPDVHKGMSFPIGTTMKK